jgi:hypothetical protein
MGGLEELIRPPLSVWVIGGNHSTDFAWSIKTFSSILIAHCDLQHSSLITAKIAHNERRRKHHRSYPSREASAILLFPSRPASWEWKWPTSLCGRYPGIRLCARSQRSIPSGRRIPCSAPSRVHDWIFLCQVDPTPYNRFDHYGRYGSSRPGSV